jgi:hypothetical protein
MEKMRSRGNRWAAVVMHAGNEGICEMGRTDPVSLVPLTAAKENSGCWIRTTTESLQFQSDQTGTHKPRTIDNLDLALLAPKDSLEMLCLYRKLPIIQPIMSVKNQYTHFTWRLACFDANLAQQGIEQR